MRTVLHADNFYPAFGLSKMQKIVDDTNKHRQEAPAKMAEAARKMAGVVGKHEKEGDWAIAGGIAQGLGGIGAGIAAAANTQIKNAEIRERNAQRDAQATQLYTLANQVNDTRLDLINADSALSDWRVSVDEDTSSLFRRLSISVGKITSFHTVEITFTMTDSSYPYKVDGYLKMITHTANGKFLGEKIIPIPLWEKDRHSAVLDCNVPYDPSTTGYGGFGGSKDVIINFEPYILWKISIDPQLEHYVRAFRVEDLEEGSYKESFIRYWRHLEDTKAKAENKKKKKNRIIVVSVLTALALIIVLIVSSVNRSNQEKAFSEGSNYIRYSSKDYYSRATELFNQLPSSYNDKIVDVCIKQARKEFADVSSNPGSYYNYDYLLFLLKTTRTRVESQPKLLNEISDMEIRTEIYNNDSAVSKTIISAYRRSEITYEAVAEYAELMNTFKPSWGRNEMVTTIVPMLEELLSEDSNFQLVIDQYNIIETAYQQAVSQFDSKDFVSCRQFFSEHLDYRNCDYYSSLCEGVAYWCGTWKDKSGNTFRIEIDQSMNIDYMDFSTNSGKYYYYYPYKVYVRIYDNGQEITKYGIKEDNFKHYDGTVDIAYKLQSNSQGLGIYRFNENKYVENSCSISKYDGDFGNAKNIWGRDYYKITD